MSNSLFVPFNPNGRPPLMTPSEVLEAFGKYLEDRQCRDIEKSVTESGITGENTFNKERTESVPHPISIRDFCIYLGVGSTWFTQLSDEFSLVKDYIKSYVEEFQLKGAQGGVFNARIVSRQLGLVDKKEVEQNTKFTFADCETKEQAKQMLRRINKE